MRTKQTNYSLRRRLMLGMLASFAILLSIISLGLWTYNKQAANQTYDLLMSGAAISILERAVYTNEGIRVDIPPSAFEIMGFAKNDRIFYRVFNQSGETLTGDQALSKINARPAASEPEFFDADFSGETVRFVQQSRLLTSNEGSEWVTILLGQTRDARNALHYQHFYRGFIGLMFITLIGMLFVWIAINRAMRPLLGMADSIREREPNDLTPLINTPPREVVSLIDAINDFMLRLKTSNANSQAFIADVAHQMRTSLSALQGQLELIQSEESAALNHDRLAQAQQKCDHTIHLMNQLLSHAMIIHRADSQPQQAVDLHKIAKSTLTDYVRRHVSSPIEFAFIDQALEHQPCIIQADPIAIRETIRNLLDNAIRHGPANNQISLELQPVQHDAQRYLRLSISDAGPGIPVDQREQVFERFYSSDQQRQTSGLGLSIVAAVAHSHQGLISLNTSEAGGLTVSIDFPLWIGEDDNDD